MNGATSRTCRNGNAVSPWPGRTRLFQPPDSQVSVSTNSGGYSHQSENNAPKRTMTGFIVSRYSASIASPIALERE